MVSVAPTVPSNLEILYGHSLVTFWVEDELTRVFLTALWGDRDIHVIAAAGRTGVEYLVAAAPDALRGRTVTGLVDCDFSTPNRDMWSDPLKPVLRTDVHEFENYLLDFDLLGAVAGENSSDIRDKAKEFAKSIQWWMTCKRVLQDIRSSLNADYPSDPTLREKIASEQNVIDYIGNDAFWRKHDEGRRSWDKKDKHLVNCIQERFQQYEDDLNDNGDAWKRTFSGKEIFRHVRTVIPGLCRVAGRGQSAAQNDENLAMLMSRRLKNPAFAQSPTLQVFQEIRAALRNRAGLQP